MHHLPTHAALFESALQQCYHLQALQQVFSGHNQFHLRLPGPQGLECFWAAEFSVDRAKGALP